MGTDLAASFSGASSASSGLQQDFRGLFGPRYIGSGSAPKSPWLWIGLGALALVGVTIFLIRR